MNELKIQAVRKIDDVFRVVAENEGEANRALANRATEFGAGESEKAMTVEERTTALDDMTIEQMINKARVNVWGVLKWARLTHGQCKWLLEVEAVRIELLNLVRHRTAAVV